MTCYARNGAQHYFAIALLRTLGAIENCELSLGPVEAQNNFGHVLQPRLIRSAALNFPAPFVAHQVAEHISPKPEFHSLAHSQNFAILVLRKPYRTTTLPLVADDKGNSAPTPTISEVCDTDY